MNTVDRSFQVALCLAAAWVASGDVSWAPPFPSTSPLSPKLQDELTSWLGHDEFSKLKNSFRYDLSMSGYAGCKQCVQQVEDVLAAILQHHRRGGDCSSMPASLVTHAWRYQWAQVQSCLSLSPNSSCSLPCSGLPELSTQLVCTGSHNLQGSPVPGECRHKLDAQVVKTSSGLLQGLVRPIPVQWADGNDSIELVRTFWGVPYGDQPERFKAAKPKQNWMGMKESMDFFVTDPPMCPDLPPIGKNVSITEDCLLLNLQVPPTASSRGPLPVFVYFQGGGFDSSDYWQGGWYDGARIAIRSDVIVITVSHRVGFLAHWAHPALGEESGDGGFGNYGALDQRLALQWIQANIAQFGGDASRVTIAGHSSGAFSVQFHLLSPDSRGLFSHAILEGVAVDTPWYYIEKDDAISFYDGLADHMGCKGSRSAAQLRCLRSLPLGAFHDATVSQLEDAVKDEKPAGWRSDASAIWNIIWSAMGFDGGYSPKGLGPADSALLATPLWPILPVGFVVDGSRSGLPDSPRKLYEAGRVNPARIYLDHATDEGTVFAMFMILSYPWYKSWSISHAAVDAMFSWIYNSTGKTFVNSLLQQYPHGRSASAPFYRMARVIQDSVFLCPARRFARQVSSRRPGSLFYAETTFAGFNRADHNWVEAVMHNDFLYFLGASHINGPRWIFGGNTTPADCTDSSSRSAQWVPDERSRAAVLKDAPRVQDAPPLQWTLDDQRMHDLVICHYGLFMHCDTPDISGALNRNCSALHSIDACRAAAAVQASPLSEEFPAYDKAHGAAYELSPFAGGLMRDAGAKDRLCGFWDKAPASGFVRSVCRGCARPHSTHLDDSLVFA